MQSTPEAARKFTCLALGDSYTVAESLEPDDSFAAIAVKRLRAQGWDAAEPEVLAKTGWTTADLLKALDQERWKGLQFDWVSLLIGVNNQYRGGSLAVYQEECTELAVRALSLAGGLSRHVCLISIPDYGVTPFGHASGRSREISAEIDRFNQVNREIALVLGTMYLDITEESREAERNLLLLASDGLHYSRLAYAQWADMMVERMLEGKESKRE